MNLVKIEQNSVKMQWVVCYLKMCFILSVFGVKKPLLIKVSHSSCDYIDFHLLRTE